MSSLLQVRLDPSSDTPLYKQLAGAVSGLIERGAIASGEKLPPTRELADQLGLNRATISAAYSLLEESGMIEGHVGRGSFVAARESSPAIARTDWDSILPPLQESAAGSPHEIEISFANSRPSPEDFPLASFRRSAKQVIDSEEAAGILQLGAPHGYPPLRRYLLEEARSSGLARASDDLIITNGCQQALDLLARLFAREGNAIAVEDPVYHGLLRVFSRAGAQLLPVPVDSGGLDVDAFEEVARSQRPRVLMVTPSFQNPTGATLSLERRKRIVDIARRYGVAIVENDIYSELRYCGKPLPSLKELDSTGHTILLRSYSKVSFPGLRVGWVIAPRAVAARLADAKRLSDLHSDQLSQAVLLRFAESGELAKHLERTRRAGAERLNAVIRALKRYLPPGATFTRPEGGMNLWIELPAPLTASHLLSRVEERGVSFLPGHYFSLRRGQARGLRISFGGLTPAEIGRGIKIIGETAAEELTAAVSRAAFEPAAALV